VSVSTSAPSLPPVVTRQRNLILVALLGLAAIGWIVFLDQAREPMDMGHDMGPDLSMGGSWPLFAATWIAMMVGMMFPAAAPMVLLYGRMRRKDPTSIALFSSPSTATDNVLAAIGEVHPTKVVAKAARKAGFQRRSWLGGL